MIPVMMNGPGAILFGARHRGGSWDPGRVPPGIYFVRLELDSGASANARCVVLE